MSTCFGLVRCFQTDEPSRAAVLTAADDTAKRILLARLRCTAMAPHGVAGRWGPFSVATHEQAPEQAA